MPVLLVLKQCGHKWSICMSPGGLEYTDVPVSEPRQDRREDAARVLAPGSAFHPAAHGSPQVLVAQEREGLVYCCSFPAQLPAYRLIGIVQHACVGFNGASIDL